MQARRRLLLPAVLFSLAALPALGQGIVVTDVLPVQAPPGAPPPAATTVPQQSRPAPGQNQQAPAQSVPSYFRGHDCEHSRPTS